jgi:signal peptidase II
VPKRFSSVTFYLIALFVVVIDQLSKAVISTSMYLGQTVPVIKNVFHLTYIRNTGAAFGIFTGQNYILAGISVMISAAVIYLHYRSPRTKKVFHSGLALILGGSFGNIISRFQGGVVDMLDFRFWPVFNAADTFINIGVFLIIIDVLFLEDKKRSK